MASLALTPTQAAPGHLIDSRPHCIRTLALLGNIGGMYTESSDLHAAGPLYQCSSLEDLDGYFRACVWMSVDIRVSVSCVVVALFGFLVD